MSSNGVAQDAAGGVAGSAGASAGAVVGSIFSGDLRAGQNDLGLSSQTPQAGESKELKGVLQGQTAPKEVSGTDSGGNNASSAPVQTETSQAPTQPQQMARRRAQQMQEETWAQVIRWTPQLARETDTQSAQGSSEHRVVIEWSAMNGTV